MLVVAVRIVQKLKEKHVPQLLPCASLLNGFNESVIEFPQLSGEFPYACESGPVAVIAVRMIKSGPQFVQPQADFRGNSIVTTHFCSDVWVFCDNRIPDQLKFSALSTDGVRTNADVKS